MDGFLTELFNLWKERNINSELTIVLFSRSHYEAVSIGKAGYLAILWLLPHFTTTMNLHK